MRRIFKARPIPYHREIHVGSGGILVRVFVLAAAAALCAVQLAHAETYKVKVVEPIDGVLKCNWARDRLITVVSSSCDDFKRPARVALGETFQANGKSKTIRVIFADRMEKDIPDLKLKAGDWTCVAAETVGDIPVMSGKSEHTGTWLWIAKCRPVE
jgi:hypothetical protein